MTTDSPLLQASLADPPSSSVITSTTNWISELFFGPLATSVAVIAIGLVGLSMLSGRIDVRRGLSVILGCFLLFGARGIAEGLRSTATNEYSTSSAAAPPPPAFARSRPAPPSTNGYDPYAGAAVIRPGE